MNQIEIKAIKSKMCISSGSLHNQSLNRGIGGVARKQPQKESEGKKVVFIL